MVSSERWHTARQWAIVACWLVCSVTDVSAQGGRWERLTAAGVQAFEIELGGLCETHWNGTAGCEKIREILSAGLPRWSDHAGLIWTKRKQILEKLRKK